MEELTKIIVVPIDGSNNSLQSIEYLNLMFGPAHDIRIKLLYILPSLPPILTDEKNIDPEIMSKVARVERKNKAMAERILYEAKGKLIKIGFNEDQVETVYSSQEKGVARDICGWSRRRQADAVLITRHGRTKIEDFLMGEIAYKMIDHCRSSPVWIVDGRIRTKKVLICMDSSENALRAVDHGGFMLSGTDCEVTIFHSMRHLRRFVPIEILEDIQGIEELWKEKSGEQFAPYLERAIEILTGAGFERERIKVKIESGSRSAADDILKMARDREFGTIIMGRRGLSAVKEFFMGSITRKVITRSIGLGTWIVQ